MFQQRSIWMILDNRHFVWTSNEKHTTREGLAGAHALPNGAFMSGSSRQVLVGPVFMRREKSRPQT